MNRQQIEEFMGELSIGRVIRRLPSDDRKRVFQQLVETAPEFSAKQFQMFGFELWLCLLRLHQHHCVARRTIKLRLLKMSAIVDSMAFSSYAGTRTL
jgi:hypothetical protein